MIAEPISSRQAARILTGSGLTARQARQVLDSGLAGEGVRTSAAVLHDARAVRELASRPFVELDRLADSCPRGVIVSRLAPGADSAVIRHDMPLMSWAEIAVMAPHLGFLPWVATVCGYVVRGGDLVGARPTAEGSSAQGVAAEFELEPPGEWCGVLEGRRFPTGPGRTWAWWGRDHGPARAAVARLRE